MRYPTLAHFWHFSHFRHFYPLYPFEPLQQPAQSPGIRQPRKLNSTKEYVRIYKLFMQNKANFENDKMNINLDMTSKYEILSRLLGKKTNPIQTQFKPIQSQLKPIQSQFKPNWSEAEILSLSKGSNPTCCELVPKVLVEPISKSRIRICSLSLSDNIYNANGSKCKMLDTLNILT